MACLAVGLLADLYVTASGILKMNRRLEAMEKIAAELKELSDKVGENIYENVMAVSYTHLIMLTPWHKDRILVDPFCGSGTFPIEAAMIAANIAPGMNRSFTAEEWTNLIPKKLWYETVNEANELINDDIEVDIQGYDVDGSVIKIARRNAREAGVDHLIHFQERDVKDLSHPKKYGFIITNPPYGERLEDKKDLPALYKACLLYTSGQS